MPSSSLLHEDAARLLLRRADAVRRRLSDAADVAVVLGLRHGAGLLRLGGEALLLGGGRGLGGLLRGLGGRLLREDPLLLLDAPIFGVLVALLLGLDVELLAFGVEGLAEGLLRFRRLILGHGLALLLPVPHAEVTVLGLERCAGHEDLAARREADAHDAVRADADALVDAALRDGWRRQRRRRGEQHETRRAGGAHGRERRERVLSRLGHKVYGRDFQVLRRRQRGRGRETERDFSDARELQGGRRRRAKSQQNVAAGRHCVFLRCAFRLSTICLREASTAGSGALPSATLS